MPVKIRLQRRGKKGKPFYQVVVADSRAPRDGKFIERIGTYNPNTNPATINLDLDKSVDWLAKGAQPTDTARAILSYKGALYKHHLAGGIRKGALTAEQAETKFSEWLEAREARIEAKRSKLTSSADEIENARKAAEIKKKEDRAKAIAAKNTPPEEEAEEAETPVAEAEVAQAEVAEAPEEAAPAEEAPKAETAAPAEEEAPKAEAPAEETPKTEAAAPAEEAPKAEAPADEAPAAEDAAGEEKDKKAE